MSEKYKNSITVTYDPGANLIELRIDGLVDRAQVDAAFERLRVDGRFPENADLIADLSGMDFSSLTYDRIKSSNQTRLGLNKYLGNSNLAIIVPGKIEQTLFALIQANSDGVRRGQEATFLSAGKARAWLADLRQAKTEPPESP